MQVASQTRSMPEVAAETDAMTGSFGDLAVAGPSRPQPRSKLDILPHASPRAATIQDPVRTTLLLICQTKPPIPFSQPLPGVDPIDFTPYLRSVDLTLAELSYLSLPDQLSHIEDIVSLLEGAITDIFAGCNVSQVPRTLFSASQTLVRIARRVEDVEEEGVKEAILTWGYDEMWEFDEGAVPPSIYMASCVMLLTMMMWPSGGTEAAREAGLHLEIHGMMDFYFHHQDRDTWFAYYQAWELINNRPLPKCPWKDEDGNDYERSI